MASNPLLALLAPSLLMACASAPPTLRPPRVAIRAGEQAVRQLTPLLYRGGFDAKTQIYETLVRRDDQGRIAAGLAARWSYEDGGRALRLSLREGARFHDGAPVRATDVATYMKRWVGLPEHDWLLASRVIEAIETPDERTIVLRLREACDVLADLCAVNPCAVQAPGALDFEGTWVRPIGSGAYAWIGPREEGRVLRVARWDESRRAVLAGSEIDLVRFDSGDGLDPLDELLAGRLDAVADGWNERLPRDRVDELARDPDWSVEEAPGSCVVFLSFRTEFGPCEDTELRRALQGAIDRSALIAKVELGHADPCTTWTAPGILPEVAKAGNNTAAPATRLRLSSTPELHVPLRLVVRSGDQALEPLADEIARQFRIAGFEIDVMRLSAEELERSITDGKFELRFERTWGLPYDPDLSFVHRFGEPLAYPSAARPTRWGRHATLTDIAQRLQRTTDVDARDALWREVHRVIDAEAVIVPLFVPHRLAVVRKGYREIILPRDIYRMDLTRLRVRVGASDAPVPAARVAVTRP